MPRTRCAGCGFVQYKNDFAPQQWTKKNKRQLCQSCVAKYEHRGTPLECINCGLWKAEAAFDPKYHHKNTINTRVCKECKERRLCRDESGGCGFAKEEDAFTPGEWFHAGVGTPGRGKCKKCILRNARTKICSSCDADLPRTAYIGNKMWNANDELRKCKNCVERKRGYWPCVQCTKLLPVDMYSLWWEKRSKKKNNGTARCNDCTMEQRDEGRGGHTGGASKRTTTAGQGPAGSA